MPGKMSGVTYRKSRLSTVLTGIVWCGTAVAMLTLAVIIIFILRKGLLHLSLQLLTALLPALYNTLLMTLIALGVAAPLGIFAAIFLVEYATGRGVLLSAIRLTTETLSGIPSIVYGLFGMLFFSVTLGWGYSLLAGSFTLAIMILPLIMRTAEEALQSVPNMYREASFGVGAGKLRTIFRIVLPAAMPGILSGIILATGRVAGETAALIFTAGTVAQYAGIMDSGRSLAVHMYVLASEGLHMDEAYATAVVLLMLVLLINLGSGQLAKRIGKG